MIIIGLLAAVVNHATNKKNLPESSSHLQLYRFDKKAINNLAWYCPYNKTRSILHCSKNEKKNNSIMALKGLLITAKIRRGHPSIHFHRCDVNF